MIPRIIEGVRREKTGLLDKVSSFVLKEVLLPRWYPLGSLIFGPMSQSKLIELSYFGSNSKNVKYLSIPGFCELHGIKVNGQPVLDPNILREEGKEFTCEGILLPGYKDVSVDVDVNVSRFRESQDRIHELEVVTQAIHLTSGRGEERFHGFCLEELAKSFGVSASWIFHYSQGESELKLRLLSPPGIYSYLVYHYHLEEGIDAVGQRICQEFEKDYRTRAQALEG